MLEEWTQAQLAKTTKKPKPIKNPASVGVQYNAEMQEIIKAIRADIDKRLIPLLRDLSPQYTTDAWPDQITTALSALVDKWQSPDFRGIADRLAAQFVGGVNTWNAKKFGTDMKRFGIDVFGDAPELNDFIRLSVANNAQLIKSIPEQYLNQVQSIVLSNVQAGARSSDIVKTLSDQFGVTKRRAKVIARDQTAKVNSALAQKRQMSVGFEYFQWIDSDDSRVRSRHEAIANKVTAYGKGIYRYDNPPLSDKGQPILPGQDYQCLPGQSQLDHATFSNILYRRWFSGELSEIVFADGIVLRTTPNHPILTDAGFKPAHLIDVSDNIIRTCDEGFLSVELHRQGVVPTFEEIFCALDFFGVERRVSETATGQFHGDVADGDIDIVEFNGLLRDVVNPSIVKKLHELSFTGADQVVIFDALSCFGQFHLGLFAAGGAFDGLMRRKNLTIATFLAHFTPLEGFGLALGSWFDPELLEVTPDDVAGNAKMFRDCILAFSVLVHGNHVFRDCIQSFTAQGVGGFNAHLLDRSSQDINGHSGHGGRRANSNSVSYKGERAVERRNVGFSGHVYNLQTVSGDYTTCATTVSNCRCIARPVRASEVEQNQQAGRVRKGVYR